MSAEEKIRSLGITLPTPTTPVATYVNAVRTGNLVFLSGKGPQPVDGVVPKGKLGSEFTVEQGYAFARSTGLSLLASLRAEIGSLDHVRRIVSLTAMVNSTPEFVDHPKVVNGCSDMLVEIFGERGRHVRAAVGAPSLPMGIPVEIWAVVEVD